MKRLLIVLNCFLLLGLVNVWAQAPQKAQITFVSDRDGDSEIYIMDADGKNQRNLTNNPAEDKWPSWFDPAVATSVSPAGKFGSTWGKIKHELFSR